MDSEHNATRDIIFESPELIEGGAISLCKEFRIKDCIIDVLLKGKDGAILIVEVNTISPSNARRQVKYYKDTIEEVIENLVSVKPQIRGYIVMPHSWTVEKENLISELEQILSADEKIPMVAREHVLKNFRQKIFPQTIKESGFVINVKYL